MTVHRRAVNRYRERVVDESQIVSGLLNSIDAGIGFLLGGDPQGFSQFVDPGDVGEDALLCALQEVPPLVDPSAAELSGLIGESSRARRGSLVVPLCDASGAPALSLELAWAVADGDPRGVAGLMIVLTGLRHHESAGAVVQRRPDAHGRLPSEQFIGSAHLRLSRVFSALPDAHGSIDRGPSNDAEAAFLLRIADDDIYNGGLEQFYSNSTGNFAPLFPAFASKVGAESKAAIVRSANALFEGAELHDRDQRNARLDSFSDDSLEELEHLTDRYYDCSENIVEFLVAFIERCPDEFLC